MHVNLLAVDGVDGLGASVVMQQQQQQQQQQKVSSLLRWSQSSASVQPAATVAIISQCARLVNLGLSESENEHPFNRHSRRSGAMLMLHCRCIPERLVLADVLLLKYH
jgi:hypothetical protein